MIRWFQLFSIITVFPVLSSVATISQRYIPTNFLVSISVNEMPNSLPKIAIFSPFESPNENYIVHVLINYKLE